MADVKQLLDEASAKLRHEAESLRSTIAERESALERELAPLRSQLGQLDDAIARIGGRPTATKPPQGARAPRGHNKRLILEALRGSQGITPIEIAAQTGIAKPTTYATLAQLAKDGEIQKNK